MDKAEKLDNICIINIGSNIDAEKNIPNMFELLGREVSIVKISSFRKTKPIGIKAQPDFTNGAVRIRTPLSREELKSVLFQIEDRLGRDRTAPKFGPRTIDLDIVAWNGEIVDNDYYTRDFIRESVEQVS